MYSTTRDRETKSILYKKGNKIVATLDLLDCSTYTIKSNESGISTIDDLLNFNLQKKTITGLYPEEVIAKAYHNNQNTSRIAIVDNISDLNTLNNRGGSDFMVAPIYKDEHFISAIVHFTDSAKYSSKNREIFVFDSQQENNTPHIGIYDGLNENPQLLNTMNLQGKSKTCGYFTAEFLSKASEFEKFQDLQEFCAKGQMQNHVYNQVRNILKNGNKNLDKLHGSYDGLKIIGIGVGYGKISDNKFSSQFNYLDQIHIKQSKSQSLPKKRPEKSYYWRNMIERNRVKRNTSTPNIPKQHTF